ncbi:MAG: hypothetical protein M3Q50_04340, partial [Chloroflexota bacterium]|nr:hypothetical protein [Chloroflexota bacterium]
LYAERGLVGARAAVWVSGETLTVEYETETLAHYRVALAANGRGFKEVTEPRFFSTDHGSPQPFLPVLDEVEWHPAQRVTPYRARRRRRGEGQQERLFADEGDQATG